MSKRPSDIERLTEGEREQFRKCITLLCGECFLIRSFPPHEKAYRFALRNYDLLEVYFDIAGWKLKRDENLGVITWEGLPSGRINFNLEETLGLLILRLLYEEKSREITLHGERTVLQQEFVEKYRVMTERPLKKTALILLLRRFQALRLIKVLGDEGDPEAKIILYPSIPFALDGMAIEEMHERIASFRKEEEEE
ncbi:MAG: DUF4194 domain-containing protein [Spirochaetia bacterium]